MNDARGDFLGPPHSTMPAAEIVFCEYFDTISFSTHGELGLFIYPSVYILAPGGTLKYFGYIGEADFFGQNFECRCFLELVSG